MKLNRKGNFWLIRKSDPIVIKTAKALIFIDFALVLGLLMTLNIWASKAFDTIYCFKISMRGGSVYYVPKALGITIYGGGILFFVLFFFLFSYLFWPPTTE